MPELYLHVGTHKTGTTAIQRFLLDNSELLKAQGILYPRTGFTDSAHQWGQHRLAWILKETNMQGLWVSLRREAEGYDRVIVSSEEFSLYVSPLPFRRMLSRIESWAHVRPVCYLRRQDQFLESLYNQYVKAGGTKTLEEVFETVKWRLDYAKFLNSLASVFGKSNIILNIYEEKLSHGDVVTDFLGLVKIDNQVTFRKRKQLINGGLSRAGVLRLKEANISCAGDPERLSQLRSEIVKDHTLPPFSSHTLLSDSEREKILCEFSDSNHFIASEYFPSRKNLFS